ncbi:MAG: hypothetical protein IH851_02085 [Armatimonadetes bacterium]|nr:hypothetical protein [Armatimonadota bacterium]
MFVVWSPVSPIDARQLALDGAKAFSEPRLTHYWESKKSVGWDFAKVVKLPEGNDYAWDVFFVYGKDAEWKAEPPVPADWMHQLADDERRLDGPRLRAAIERELKKGGMNE